ncbi:hypothetical protein J3D48_006280 [Pseudomonas fluorescens]|uniref:hypothetical protein n=1 Tax=Pseudomonas fluorescens TaxID=294 RepID=UPI0020A14A04|nr:hypothetical protein [Pseudomonas fluorescens]MCP1489870.1 hypothetical protein [Pseudomonas fluorescens]
MQAWHRHIVFHVPLRGFRRLSDVINSIKRSGYVHVLQGEQTVLNAFVSLK